MAREIPEAVRAVAGLAVTVLDEARRLPQTILGLPVRVFGLAMQASLKLQQSYSGLVARGDEVFTGLLGVHEPGMATFDEDEEDLSDGYMAEPVPGPGLRDSAFDRAADTGQDDTGQGVAALIDDEVAGLPQDPAPEEVLDALADLNRQVADADLPAEPADQQVVTGDAEALESALLESDRDGAGPGGGAGDGDAAVSPAPSDPGGSPVGEAEGAPDVDGATSGAATDLDGAAPDVATEVDVPTPDGGVATVEATITDEGIAAPVADEAPGGPPADDAVAVDESGTPVAAGTGHRIDVDEEKASPDDDAAGSQAAGTAPVDGYDGFTIAQLRGRLRGYQRSTVQQLLDYEERTRAREPYVRMLRNRLERLQADAG